MGRLLVHRKESLWVFDTEAGRATTLGKPDWRNLRAWASLNGTAYAVIQRTLYQIELDEGKLRPVGKTGDWGAVTAMCALGDRLYIIAGRSLYWADPDSGEHDLVGAPFTWEGEVMMASAANQLLMVHHDRLFRVSPSDGIIRQLSGKHTWQTATALCHHSDGLALIIGELKLLEIRPSDGKQRVLHRGKWYGFPKLARNGDGIYMINTDDLYRVDPDTAEHIRMTNNRAWTQVHRMLGIHEVGQTPPGLSGLEAEETPAAAPSADDATS